MSALKLNSNSFHYVVFMFALTLCQCESSSRRTSTGTKVRGTFKKKPTPKARLSNSERELAKIKLLLQKEKAKANGAPKEWLESLGGEEKGKEIGTHIWWSAKRRTYATKMVKGLGMAVTGAVGAVLGAVSGGRLFKESMKVARKIRGERERIQYTFRTNESKKIIMVKMEKMTFVERDGYFTLVPDEAKKPQYARLKSIKSIDICGDRRENRVRFQLKGFGRWKKICNRNIYFNIPILSKTNDNGSYEDINDFHYEVFKQAAKDGHNEIVKFILKLQTCSAAIWEKLQTGKGPDDQLVRHIAAKKLLWQKVDGEWKRPSGIVNGDAVIFDEKVQWHPSADATNFWENIENKRSGLE